MRVFLTVLVLIFSLQSWAKADDIRDFELEGMSVGDSLLNYFTEEKIKRGTKDYYPKSKKFFRVALKSNVETYEWFGVHLKKNDSNYKIYSLEGSNYIKYSDCKKQSKLIEKELKDIFNNKFSVSINEYPHSYDKSNKSMLFRIRFYDDEKNYSPFNIDCTDWSKKMEKNGFHDSLAVYINSKVFYDFISNEAYK